MKQYDKNTFITNFNKIIEDHFEVKAEDAKYIIKPNYDPSKSESGEDSVFRMVILSDDNIGNKTIGYEDTVDVLTMFSPHFPTKVVISKEPKEDEIVFIVDCSTRVRKPSAIANIENGYSPFTVK